MILFILLFLSTGCDRESLLNPQHILFSYCLFSTKCRESFFTHWDCFQNWFSPCARSGETEPLTGLCGRDISRSHSYQCLSLPISVSSLHIISLSAVFSFDALCLPGQQVDWLLIIYTTERQCWYFIAKHAHTHIHTHIQICSARRTTSFSSFQRHIFSKFVFQRILLIRPVLTQWPHCQEIIINVMLQHKNKSSVLTPQHLMHNFIILNSLALHIFWCVHVCKMNFLVCVRVQRWERA